MSRRVMWVCGPAGLSVSAGYYRNQDTAYGQPVHDRSEFTGEAGRDSRDGIEGHGLALLSPTPSALATASAVTGRYRQEPPDTTAV